MAKAVERPLSVTLVMIYAGLVGLMNIGMGIFTILDRNNVNLVVYSLSTPAQLLTAGIIAIVVGAIQLLMAVALGTGNNIVRIIFGVIAAINLAISTWAALALSGEERAVGVFGVIFAILALYLLFNQHAEAYFEEKNKA